MTIGRYPEGEGPPVNLIEQYWISRKIYKVKDRILSSTWKGVSYFSYRGRIPTRVVSFLLICDKFLKL